MSGYELAVEETESAVSLKEFGIKTIKQRKSKSKRRLVSPKSKALFTRLDEGDYAKLKSLSDYIGFSPSVLSRVFLRQALSKYSLQEELDNLVVQLVTPMPEIIPLSCREIEVLNLMAQGISNKEIGSGLGIGENTIKNHITSILYKLGADNRTHAVLLALRYNLVKPQIVKSRDVSATGSTVDRKEQGRMPMNNHAECVGVKHSGSSCPLSNT